MPRAKNWRPRAASTSGRISRRPHRDDDIAVLGRQGAIDDQQVAVEDAGVDHGIAAGADKERGGRMVNEMLVKVQMVFDVIIRLVAWRPIANNRESGCHVGPVPGSRCV
jgi:hypothetical protein